MDSEAVPYQKDPEDPALSETERAIIRQLKKVYDPEIPVDIYELGLIYAVIIDGAKATVHMTLTAPGCPVAGVMPDWVQESVIGAEGIDECEVVMEWDPPWRMDMMSMRAKIELNMI